MQWPPRHRDVNADVETDPRPRVAKAKPRTPRDLDTPRSLEKEMEKCRPGSTGRAGLAKEQRVLWALQELAARTPQLAGARASSEREDAAGVDVVAQLVTRDIPIQVKSSHDGAKRFRRHHAGIPVVVVSDVDTDVELKHALLRLLHHFLEP